MSNVIEFPEKVTRRKRSRATRSVKSAMNGGMAEHLHPEVRKVLGLELTKKERLDQVLKRMGKGRVWRDEIVALHVVWTGLRYSTRAFLFQVGAELPAANGTSLVEDTFRRFHRHVMDIEKQGGKSGGRTADNYMVQLEAYRKYIDFVTESMQYALLMEARVGDATWHVEDQPFETWRETNHGPIRMAKRPGGAAALIQEDIRRMFMIRPELDLYHGRFEDEV